MATVYGRVNGEDLQRLVARTEAVQRKLDQKALQIGVKAEKALAKHHQTGNAQVTIESGHIDRYVGLIDPPSTSSPGAAWYIEFGHKIGKRPAEGHEDNRQTVKGLWIIHDAAGLPRAAWKAKE